MNQILTAIEIVNNENKETTVRYIAEYFRKIDLIKKKKKLLYTYSLPRANLIKKIIRNIAPIVTHITGIP